MVNSNRENQGERKGETKGKIKGGVPGWPISHPEGKTQARG